jgi:hypothetical protein
MIDDHAPAKRLGDLCETISFSRWDVVAGSVVLAVMGISGVLVIIASLRAAYHANWALASWVGVGVCCLVGASLITTGIVFAKIKRDQLTHRFDFCANGFRYYFRGSLDRVLWSQVSCIRETVSALPKRTASRYKIVTASGKEYDFKGNSPAMRRFTATLRTRAAELSLPWETVEDRS